MSTPRTDVDITIRLTLLSELTPEVRDSLSNLADVMLVQAEDGLYRLGWRDAEDGEVDGTVVENSFMAEIVSSTVVSIEKTEEN